MSSPVDSKHGSWFGTFARSLSGQSLRPAAYDYGVELTHLNDGTDSFTSHDFVMCNGTQGVTAGSLPASTVSEHGITTCAPSSEPLGGHAATTGLHAVPVLVHPPALNSLQSQHHEHVQPLTMSRNSSSGLPSALVVPAAGDAFVTTPDTTFATRSSFVAEPDAVDSASTACRASIASPVAGPSAIAVGAALANMLTQQAERCQYDQQKVRWSLPDTTESQGQHQESVATATGNSNSGLACAAPAADASASTVLGRTSRTIDSRSPRGGKLPSSGNEKLDNYLKYLLRENHPHRFMYYPNWGLTEEGCAAIGEFLRRDKVIKVMTLSGNNVVDDGVELIAEGLAANTHLLTLDLSNNKITDVGAIALAEALHQNKALAELQLNNNRIGDEGAEALAAAVASSTTLKKLHLQGNRLSSAQQQVVQHVLKTRQYKMPTKQVGASNSKLRLRKNSSHLQFHIELSDSEDVLKSVARLQLPPATAVLALSEPTDPLEESLSTQVTHLVAELESKTAARPTEQQLVQDSGVDLPAAVASASGSGSGGSKDAVQLLPLLALRLAWRGYEVVLRTSCPTSVNGEQQAAGTKDANTSSMLGLKHTFIRVVQPSLDETSPAVIIDPYFKDNFQIPHMTDRFTSVLDALPRVLCLAESRLYHLVEAITQELKVALKESGLSCPPWREANTVMDKWLAQRPFDVTVDPDMSEQQLCACSANASSGSDVSPTFS